jgi:hypothetical protein
MSILYLCSRKIANVGKFVLNPTLNKHYLIYLILNQGPVSQSRCDTIKKGPELK